MRTTADLARRFGELESTLPLSGTVLVACAGEVVFQKAFGFASQQLHVPNTLESKFHIASLTKMFTAMAALILTEQGLLRLEAHPATYLPELASLDPNVTLHQLLSHTAGLQDIYEVPNLRLEMLKFKHEGGTLLSYLAQLPQLFHPGAGWRYSSTGYILTGYIMERVTGLPFADLLHRLVLEPLSLTETGIDIPGRINPGRVYGHDVANGQVVNAGYDRLSDFPEAPGELYSTASDLCKWCEALFACPLVSPTMLEQMFTPHARVGSDVHYGYGWFLGSHARWHGGGTAGFLSRLRQYPAQRTSLILLFNSHQVNPDTVVSAVEPLLI